MSATSTARKSYAEYLTVSEAAEVIGVSTWTLRNWDKSGKLKPRRQPQNGYRIYRLEDLEAILDSNELVGDRNGRFAPGVDWSEIGATEHFVQFYDRDAFLVDSVGGFIGSSLKAGSPGIVIATAAHRNAIEKALTAQGLDLAAARASGQYVSLDAAETLSQIMVNGSPDAQRFKDVVGGIVAQVLRSWRGLRAFGEMVALLWAEGNQAAAIRLEELWNDLSKSHSFALLCAYPMNGFVGERHGAPFGDICRCHTRLIPAESYAGLSNSEDRLRAVVLLQQKAQSLEAEIAHRKEVEKALAKRERELSDFFENAAEGLHQVGPDGRILWANKAELDLLGYQPEEYVGHPIAEFHVDRDVIDEMLARLLRGETIHNGPARMRCKDGSIKHVLVHSNAYFEDGEFIHSRCFTRDVTDRVRAEEALREADRRKDEFLATLAHELRSPLAPISNSLQMMRLDNADSEVVEEANRIVDRQVQQMVRLVDDLLDISRITQGKLELRKHRIELAAVIKNAVEISRPLIESASHKLSVSLPSRPIYLDGDLVRLAQVFTNLLNNSAKYTDRGGQIHVTAEEQKQEVVVKVRDTGIGIPADALQRIFGMFQQVDHSLERSHGGLGIGLTLVRRLVELHGGTVDVHSEGVGKGSEFIVRLPVAVTNPASPTEPSLINSPAATAKKRILVVDDNKDSAATLSMMLQIMGNEVRVAHDGREAIAAAADLLPDIIFMDVGMPIINGYDATREIRAMLPGKEMTIVALTGWGQAEDVQRAMEAGCSAHMVKPIDLAALRKLLAGA